MTGTPTIEASLVDLEPASTVTVRIRTDMATLDIGALFDEHIPRVLAALAEHDTAPGGPPFARYHEFGPAWADVEFGFPVTAVIAGLPQARADRTLEIGVSELPGGRTGMAVHLGSYETLGQAYDQLRDWMRARDLEVGDGPWESYVGDPSAVADPADLRTEVYWPVR